jgi:hypothetical protein
MGPFMSFCLSRLSASPHRGSPQENPRCIPEGRSGTRGLHSQSCYRSGASTPGFALRGSLPSGLSALLCLSPFGALPTRLARPGLAHPLVFTPLASSRAYFSRLGLPVLPSSRLYQPSPPQGFATQACLLSRALLLRAFKIYGFALAGLGHPWSSTIPG